MNLYPIEIINDAVTFEPHTYFWYTFADESPSSETPWTLTFVASEPGTSNPDTFVIYKSSGIDLSNIIFNRGNVNVQSIFIISDDDIILAGGTVYGNFIANGFNTLASTTVYGTLSAIVEPGDNSADGKLSLPLNDTTITTINYVQPTLELTYRMRQLTRSAVQTETSALRKAYYARADLRNSAGTIVGYIETYNRVSIHNDLNTFNTDTSISLYDPDKPSSIAVKFSYISATSTLTSTVKSVASAYSGKYMAPPLVTITPAGNKCVVTITDAANVR